MSEITYLAEITFHFEKDSEAAYFDEKFVVTLGLPVLVYNIHTYIVQVKQPARIHNLCYTFARLYI